MKHFVKLNESEIKEEEKQNCGLRDICVPMIDGCTKNDGCSCELE